jgi:zinc D-Ala-D-Ala carboxypeptidase
MIPNEQFTPNFSLHELLVSETAARFGFDEQYNPPPAVVNNLRLLAVNVLQPLRNAVGYAVHVNSGYRCLRVNTSVGGAPSSQHLTGHAADIQDLTNGNEFLLKKIVELKLPFDQVINEFGYKWVHVSYDAKRSRQIVLAAVKDKNFKTVYRQEVIV